MSSFRVGRAFGVPKNDELGGLSQSDTLQLLMAIPYHGVKVTWWLMQEKVGRYSISMVVIRPNCLPIVDAVSPHFGPQASRVIREFLRLKLIALGVFEDSGQDFALHV